LILLYEKFTTFIKENINLKRIFFPWSKELN